MKILKIKLFQETACYKKPFSFKVAETYPLPPYSTVIGMLHKILGAKCGEYFPMDISIQGDYESIFTNYQNLRKYKSEIEVTCMPMNVHQLLNINLIIHVEAEDKIIDRLYENIINGKETFTLGRNEDLVRLDEVKIINDIKFVDERYMTKSAYVNKEKHSEVSGINYKLNTVYKIENELRKWEKVNVVYVEKNSNVTIEDAMEDEDGDVVLFYNK